MTYNFGLFESPGNYTIFLIGLNQYEKKNSSITRIEFEPLETVIKFDYRSIVQKTAYKSVLTKVNAYSTNIVIFLSIKNTV